MCVRAILAWFLLGTVAKPIPVSTALPLPLAPPLQARPLLGSSGFGGSPAAGSPGAAATRRTVDLTAYKKERGIL